MRKGLLYIHGKGGTAAEAAHYQSLFPDWDVAGMPYQSDTPWEAPGEFRRYFDAFRREHGPVVVAANSIGAYFALHALHDRQIERACFISPIVDMEGLIGGMMVQAGITEEELRERGTVETDTGALSWRYLTWVREHPVSWPVPTAILYGGRDELQSADMIRLFARRTGAEVTVMEDSGHWFHTAEQTAFLDAWLRRCVQG